jgi:hypothetical protein
VGAAGQLYRRRRVASGWNWVFQGGSNGGSFGGCSFAICSRGSWYMVRGINKVQLTGWLGIGGRKALASVEVAGTHRTYRRQRARAWFGVWSLGVLQLQADRYWESVRIVRLVFAAICRTRQQHLTNCLAPLVVVSYCLLFAAPGQFIRSLRQKVSNCFSASSRQVQLRRAGNCLSGRLIDKRA